MRVMHFAFFAFMMLFSLISYSANLQKISDLEGNIRAYFLSGAMWSVNLNYETSETGPLPDISVNESTPIFVRSPGGNFLGPKFFLNWLERQIKNNPGVKPKVVLFSSCKSACIAFLAGVNKLSRDGKITLEMDDEMIVGIHGSDGGYPDQIYTAPDEEQLQLIEQLGGNHDWLVANGKLFSRPEEDYMAEFKPFDPRLKGSNLVDDASIKPRKEIVEFFRGLKGFRNQILRRGFHEIDENWLVRIK